MVVRVRIRISRGDRVIETSALANSGYEAETPQILVPVELARELDLWPPARGAEETVFETAGGPLKVWIIPSGCRVRVVTPDTETEEVEADLVISPLADEVLLSDKLISELKIALEDVGRGYWRFTWEPKEKLRRSEPPKRWK
ncbi:MAG: hypothetical protein QXW41_07695 [Fervidicoccaceae archaeon]